MKTRLYIVIILLFRISYPGHGQTISRVIKEIDSFSGPFLEMDSLLYFYGGDRGDTFISYNNFSFHFDSAFRSTSGGAGAIIGNSYYLCTYNANNSTLSYLSYTGSAYDSIRNFYSYDANNNLTSATYQSVPNLPVRLVNSGSDTMEYDSYNNNIYTLSRIWDTLSRSWTNSGQNFITYM